MAKLVRSKVEIEGTIYEELALVEGEEIAPWGDIARLSYVGKPIQKVDSVERVSGRATYTTDILLPGMLYGKAIRSAHPHARIRKIDTSRAEALEGMRAVITHLNTPRIEWQNESPLLDNVARYAGEEIGAVAADTEEIAEDALRLIDVEYEPLPFVVDGEEALKPGAPQVHAGGNLVGGRPRVYQRGDLTRGFAESDIVVEHEYRTQCQVHNPMEPHGYVASWDGDSLTLWESTQSIANVREEAAEAFGLPLSKVRVICEYMGGGFGSKQTARKGTFLTALLAKEAGRPVKLILDRREDMLCTGNRQPTVQRLKIGARKDGTLMAIDLNATVAIGAYGTYPMPVDGPAQTLYLCPNVRTEVRTAFTNTGPHCAFRGPGYAEGSFALETLLDEIADSLGIDPYDIRAKNYADKDQVMGQPYSAKRLDQCYRKAAEMVGWKPRGGATKEESKVRAWGMASQIWGGGGGPPAYAWVKINTDATVEIIIGGQDIGTGTKTVFAQIAAEELKMDLEMVRVHLGDTQGTPYAPVSSGSRTTPSVGPAVRSAARDARMQLLEIVASYVDAPIREVDIRNGNIYIADEPSPRKNLKDLAEEVGELNIVGRGSRGPNKQGLDLRTFGAQFAEVEVDTTTGKVRVNQIVTVHDSGLIINPLGAGGQLEGGVVQGVGFALTEERIIDARSGIVLNPTLEDYRVPTAMDSPPVDYAFVSIPDEAANNLGAKGLGEPPLIPTAPAIANAIARATGVRIRSLPITSGEVLEGLRKVRGTQEVVS